MSINAPPLEPLALADHTTANGPSEGWVRTLQSKAVRGLEFAFTMWSTLLALPRTAMTRAGRSLSFVSAAGVTMVERSALVLPPIDGDTMWSCSKLQYREFGSPAAASTSYAPSAHFQAAETTWAVAWELHIGSHASASARVVGVAPRTMSIWCKDVRLLLSLRAWKPPGQAEEGYHGVAHLGRHPAADSSAEA